MLGSGCSSGRGVGLNTVPASLPKPLDKNDVFEDVMLKGKEGGEIHWEQ